MLSDKRQKISMVYVDVSYFHRQVGRVSSCFQYGGSWHESKNKRENSRRYSNGGGTAFADGVSGNGRKIP